MRVSYDEAMLDSGTLENVWVKVERASKENDAKE